MATLTATIRWATNTAELATTLQKGVVQIETTQEAAEKMVKTMAGLDGATKPAVSSITSLSDWFGKLGTQVVTTMAGFVSAQAIIGLASKAWDLYVGFLKDSVKAFAEAEAAQVKLTAALKAQHTATPELIDQYNQLATEFQRTTVYSDDLITSMQALLVQVGGIMPSQMKEALQASADLASGLGIDLQQATMLVAKAAAGHTETLGRYGIVVGEAALKTKGFDAVLEAINRQFGGQATAQMGTYAGQVAQMGNAWDNVKEAAGKFITQNPIINAGLRSATEALKKADTGTTEWSSSLASLADQGHLKGYATIIGWIERYLDRLNQVAAMQKRLADMPSPFAKTAEEMAKFPDPGGLAYFKALNEAEDATKKVTAATKANTVSLEEHNLALGIVAGNTAEETEALLNVAGATDTWGMGIGQLNQRVPDLTAHIEEQARMFDALSDSIEPLATETLPQFQRVELATGQVVNKAMMLVADSTADAARRIKSDLEKAPTWFEKLKDGALQLASGLNDVFRRAFEGGGGILGAIQSVATTGTALLLKMIPVVGAFLSQFSGAIVAGFTKLIDLFKSAEEKINPMRAAFVAAAGGLDALRDAATAAGVTIDALLQAKNAEQYKAAIDALNLAFEEHAADIDRAKELIDEYKLSIDQLGPAWRAQELDAQVKGLMNDLRIMVDVLGLSMPDALTVMAGKFQAAFDTALKFGIELPPQMQPVLQQMIDLGLLVDANGNKYTTLEGTGVKFSETFSGAVDRLIAKFDEFLKGIGLSPSIADRAAEGIESGLNRIHPSPVHVQVILDWPNTPAPVHVPVEGAAMGGLVTATGIQHLSTGGRVLAFTPRGTDKVPAMLTPGEEVIPVGGRAKEMAPVVAAINALRRELPQELAVAVRDEVQKKVGRR